MHIALKELAHAPAAIAQIEAIERTLWEYGVQATSVAVNFTGPVLNDVGRLSFRSMAIRGPYELSWIFTFNPQCTSLGMTYTVSAWIQFYVKKDDGYTSIDGVYLARENTWSISKTILGSHEPNSAPLYGHVSEGPCTSADIHAFLKEAAALLVPATA